MDDKSAAVGEATSDTTKTTPVSAAQPTSPEYLDWFASWSGCERDVPEYLDGLSPEEREEAILILRVVDGGDDVDWQEVVRKEICLQRFLSITAKALCFAAGAGVATLVARRRAARG